MSSHFTPFTLKDISRPGGGFAMLAVDQREAMRLMFAAAGQPKPIADSVLTDFKVAATRILSPYASAVLADKQFCLEQIVEQGAVANSCGLIVAADLFIPGNGIPVDSVEIDMSVDPHKAREMGAKAMKLLVLWREDEPAEERLAMVDKFVRRCRSAGLVSIAMKGGASGFLAGRAVWASVVGAQDPQTMLRDVSVPRLQRLAEIVDEGIAQR